MSVSYIVLPITEKERNIEFIAWLNSGGVNFPEHFMPGRNPSVDEIRAILSNPELWTVRPTHQIGYLPVQTVNISDGRSSTEFTVWQEHDHSVKHFSFRGGGDLVEIVMQQFANTCGTFLVVENGEDPFFVFPNISPENNPRSMS
jgi:hypothetical protein